MDAKELKKYIRDNGKVASVLEAIGCHHIKYHQSKGYWSCGNYDGDNTTAVNVYDNEYLGVTNWTRAEFDDRSDIITLVQYNKNCTFIDAANFLRKHLGISDGINRNGVIKSTFNPLAIFENAVSRKRNVDVGEIQTLDDDAFDEYTPILHYDWFKEGIMPWARKKFGICYSYKRSRIVIPHRRWNDGKLIGANMRTTIANHDSFGITKYWLTPGMNKSANVYGLYENYESIKEAGYVIVFESEKSVLKMYSKDGHENCDWFNRYGFNGKACVALSGKAMSEEQMRIIIGLNVDVVIALDKDVDINEVRYMCEKFYRVRKVSYIYDKYNLLGEKDSPADVNIDKFKWLFKWRIDYDEMQHKEYMKSINK